MFWIWCILKRKANVPQCLNITFKSFSTKLYKFYLRMNSIYCTGSSVVEQMPAKGMVLSSILNSSVGFLRVWPLCRQRRELNTYFQHNMGKLIYQFYFNQNSFSFCVCTVCKGGSRHQYNHTMEVTLSFYIDISVIILRSIAVI